MSQESIQNATGECLGTVYRKSTGFYRVHVDGCALECTISSKLRKQLEYPTADPSSRRQRVIDVRKIKTVDPVAVGDRVRVRRGQDDTGVIVDIVPRRSKICRHAASRAHLEQVIVANVDRVIPVFAVAEPEPKWGLLDRYLVSAEAAELPVIICLTKWDLADEDDLGPIIDLYRSLGYPALVTSAHTGRGLDELRAALHDRTSVMLGKSGVGKTTLLNAIEPGLGLRTSAVSDATGKGTHTTSHLEMFDLAGGGRIIDTPGVREFAPVSSDDDLAALFPEMRGYLGHCDFGLRCTHTHEPGCAIKRAVECGEIAYHRYQSFLSLATD